MKHLFTKKIIFYLKFHDGDDVITFFINI